MGPTWILDWVTWGFSYTLVIVTLLKNLLKKSNYLHKKIRENEALI